jgi:hypothetical protein
VPPEAAAAAVTAGLRLDDALRGFLAEQGTKRAGKEDLWSLAMATQRLRLTANTLAGLREAPSPDGVMAPVACLPLEGSESYAGTPPCLSLRTAAVELAGFYGRVADEVGRPGREAPELIPAPPLTGPAVPRHAMPEPDKTEPDETQLNETQLDGTQLDGTQLGGAQHDGARQALQAPVSIASYRPHPHMLWVQEHLHHLSQSAQAIAEPALHLAEARRRPWWR